MKTTLHRAGFRWALALLCGGGFHLASGVQLGDDRQTVIQEMGPAAGLLRAGDREWLSWPRGRVELKDDRVVAVELLTPQELEAKLRREAEEAEAAQRAAQERKQRQEEEGRQVYARMLSSEAVRGTSPARQVALWKEFMQNYPGVDATEPYLAALNRLEEEQAREREQAEMARLRAAAEAATWRALDAEREAQQARALRYYDYATYEWNWRDYRRRTYDFDCDSPGFSRRSPYEGHRMDRVAEVPSKPATPPKPPVVQDNTYRVPTSPMQYDFHSPSFP